jgi:hypothetical protein
MGKHEEYGKQVMRAAAGTFYTDTGPSIEVNYGAGHRNQAIYNPSHRSERRRRRWAELRLHLFERTAGGLGMFEHMGNG